MKKILFFSLAVLSLSSCGKVDELNYQVYKSTEAINNNRAAVQRSTAVIRENGRIIEGSSQAIENNRKALEHM